MFLNSKFGMKSLMMSMLIACAAASCVTDEELVEAEGAVAQELDAPTLLRCAVNGNLPRIDCVDGTRSTSVRRVSMTIDEIQVTIPDEFRLYEWNVTSPDGGVMAVPGTCFFTRRCEFDVQPECTQQIVDKEVNVVLTISDRRRPAVFVQDKSTIRVTSAAAGTFGCLLQRFSGCLSRPAGAPFTTILSSYCGGQHRMYANQIPGQTYTQIQTKGSRTLSWSKVSDTYDFPGITVENQNGYCDGDSYGDFYARARACNECGCGPWGPESFFSYFPYECR